MAFGNPLFTAATLGASLLYNHSQRRNAERQAAVQWLPANAGLAFFTTHRLAVHGNLGWYETAWTGLRNAEIDPSGIVLWAAQGSPVRMIVPGLAWHYVMLRHLAWGQIVRVPILAALAAKAALHGRRLPVIAPAIAPPQPWAPPTHDQHRD